jgi:hypothetical protein
VELGTFKDEIRHGRTVYGSGKKLVQDAQLKLTVDKRAGDKTFADYAKARKANFGEAAEAFISHLAVNERSRDSYLSAYRTHVKPVYGDSTLARVADDRDGVLNLLTVRMKDLSISVRRNARMIITGTCDEAVKAGKIRQHRGAPRFRAASEGTGDSRPKRVKGGAQRHRAATRPAGAPWREPDGPRTIKRRDGGYPPMPTLTRTGAYKGSPTASARTIICRERVRRRLIISCTMSAACRWWASHSGRSARSSCSSATASLS